MGNKVASKGKKAMKVESNGKERMLPTHYSFKTKAKTHRKKKKCIAVSGTYLDYFKSRKGPQKLTVTRQKSPRIL